MNKCLEFIFLFTNFDCSRLREQIQVLNKMEQDLIYKALANLEQTAGIKGRWKPIAPNTKNKDLDGKIEFVLEGGAYKVNAEVKNHLRAIHLPGIYALAQQHTPFMLIADQIYPKIKEELRNHHIAYLEANGNIWLKYDKGLYWIDTHKALPEEKEKVNRAFTKTGLKVLFDILRDEALINLPYREIAQRTEVALGNINYILNGLKEKGFLVKLNKNEYKLNNKKELLNTWITQYDEKLKPTLHIGTFRFLKEEDFLQWKKLPLKGGKTWWGGEPGGYLYTHYLKPAVLTLYTAETRIELIKKYRLVPDPNGNVNIYRKFWTHDEVNDHVVPPLLVYADLMNTGDHRCMETAQKLYHELFEGKL